MVSEMVDSVRGESYPELRGADIAIVPFHSDSVYLRTRFSVPGFLLRRKLSYLVFFNEEALRREVPPDGLRAIVAHELAHIDYFHSRRRLQLLGLVRLASPRITARFERAADMKTVALGYGQGLIQYREWLYRNIPPSALPGKKRDYLSPDEIAAILQRGGGREQSGVSH
jgi:hypothetical protein